MRYQRPKKHLYYAKLHLSALHFLSRKFFLVKDSSSCYSKKGSTFKTQTFPKLALNFVTPRPSSKDTCYSLELLSFKKVNFSPANSTLLSSARSNCYLRPKRTSHLHTFSKNELPPAKKTYFSRLVSLLLKKIFFPLFRNKIMLPNSFESLLKKIIKENHWNQ